HAQGVQMAIHTNGDAAVDWTLDVLQEAQRQHPRSDARHRLEHVQIISEEQLARMAQMGVMANFFISHVFYFGDRHRLQFFGPRRAHRINPLRSALAHRVQFAVHNDNPVTPLNPLHSMWIASSRITRAGVPLGPDQRITPSQALRAYTIDAAYQAFEDHLKGRLAVGRYADFVVLSHNPLALPVPLLKDIALHMTVQGGHVTYTDHSIPVPAPLSFWARYLQSFQQSHPDFFLSHN
ncbi:MAG: amidohydrolase family protein, partial [archaeon]|nr:amidohydrolase family protein [archaeon]